MRIKYLANKNSNSAHINLIVSIDIRRESYVLGHIQHVHVKTEWHLILSWRLSHTHTHIFAPIGSVTMIFAAKDWLLSKGTDTFPISERGLRFYWQQVIRIWMSFHFIKSFGRNISYRFERTVVTTRVLWMKLTSSDYSIDATRFPCCWLRMYLSVRLNSIANEICLAFLFKGFINYCKLV